MGKMKSSHFLRFFDHTLFIFAGDEDMLKSLDEFEIRPGATTGFHGNRYDNSGKNGVITFSRTFLIGFISYMQVTVTRWTKQAFSCSKFLSPGVSFGQIQHLRVSIL